MLKKNRLTQEFKFTREIEIKVLRSKNEMREPPDF